MLNLEIQAIDEQAAVLKVAGEATVEHAQQLQEALLDGLRRYRQLGLDCAAVREIDFFTIQMICSAHRTSVVWDKIFSFHGEPAAKVREAIAAVGFARHAGCALCPEHVRCMWL